jgi:RNA polymerase sigma-70 factor (ECF subfamily)
MDTAYPLLYNASAVSSDKVRNAERERLGSEIMIYLDHLYRVAFYLAKNEEDAHDCVQETCARALNAHRQFASGTNLKAWLTRILYNFFFDSLARHKRTVSVDELSGEAGQKRDYWEGLATEEAGPEKRLLQQELSVKVNEALKKIPAEFRAPIVLVDMGEFSYQEAAEILNCPIGTVRSRLSRGRKLLENLMGGYLH